MFQHLFAVLRPALLGVSAMFASSSFAAPDDLSKLADAGTNLLPAGYSAAYQLIGVSHHFEKARSKRYHFNEFHAGLGIEVRAPEVDGVVRKYSFGAMRDSVWMWGTYASASWQLRSSTLLPGFHVDAGAGAFAFYRALNFNGKRKLIPAVLPLVSIEHDATGWGANVVYSPKMRAFNGQLPALVYLQATKAW